MLRFYERAGSCTVEFVINLEVWALNYSLLKVFGSNYCEPISISGIRTRWVLGFSLDCILLLKKLAMTY